MHFIFYVHYNCVYNNYVYYNYACYNYIPSLNNYILLQHAKFILQAYPKI